MMKSLLSTVEDVEEDALELNADSRNTSTNNSPQKVTKKESLPLDDIPSMGKKLNSVNYRTTNLSLEK